MGQRRVHGESRSRRVGKRTNMKNLFLVAAFLAVALGVPVEETQESGPSANAEADPWYGYYGYAHRPYGYGYYGYGHRYGYGYYGKREAEPAAEPAANPEAEADPWYGILRVRIQTLRIRILR